MLGKNKSKKHHKHRKVFWITVLIFWVIIAIVNALAFLLPGFSDWYIDHITPLWVNTYSRLTGLVSFSVGEIMLCLAILIVFFTLVGTISLIFLHRRPSFRKFMRRLYKTDIAIITLVCLLMTLNCSVLYRASTIDANPEVSDRQYTTKELYTLRNYIVSKCNEYSELIERDSEGCAVYTGDIQQEASDAMNNISSIYPRLKGYYPQVKSMMFSSLMCQSYMEGYYFPFSMEANANSMMYIVNYPESYCHELSHLHGYLFEDEANFISFLACTQSDDNFFIYSGYMKMLNYVVNAFAPYMDTLSDEELSELVTSSELVDKDNIFVKDDVWHQVEENAVLSTQTVSEASSAFTDATLKANGVSDGMASYNRVVALLLKYYDGKLY